MASVAIFLAMVLLLAAFGIWRGTCIIVALVLIDVARKLGSRR